MTPPKSDLGTDLCPVCQSILCCAVLCTETDSVLYSSTAVSPSLKSLYVWCGVVCPVNMLNICVCSGPRCVVVAWRCVMAVDKFFCGPVARRGGCRLAGMSGWSQRSLEALHPSIFQGRSFSTHTALDSYCPCQEPAIASSITGLVILFFLFSTLSLSSYQPVSFTVFLSPWAPKERRREK